MGSCFNLQKQIMENQLQRLRDLEQINKLILVNNQQIAQLPQLSNVAMTTETKEVTSLLIAGCTGTSMVCIFNCQRSFAIIV